MQTTESISWAIDLQDVQVVYRLPVEKPPTLKEHAIQMIQGRHSKAEQFVALNNINLRIESGESIAVIGSNGAGKSTLLKLIAGVLTPTAGRVRVKGVISPLIELGTGFHPELNGHENIYLNGALLGFSRAEMNEKYHRIVAFADIGNFIKSPIRTYSSGMLMRLAFAVATEIEPDILIVDEVLAVGDRSFQQKCFKRISRFQEQGVTILIVSHAEEQLKQLCNRAVWIKEGMIAHTGDVEDTLTAYKANVLNRSN